MTNLILSKSVVPLVDDTETSNNVVFIKVEPQFYLDDKSNTPFAEISSTEKSIQNVSQANIKPINKVNINESGSKFGFNKSKTLENETKQNEDCKTELLEKKVKNNNSNIKRPQKKLEEKSNKKETKEKEKKSSNKGSQKKKKNTTSQETPKSLECVVCSRKFSTPSQIKTHTQHESFHMRCLLCNVDYTDPEQLYIDVRSHIKDKNYVCENCGNSYGTRGNLTYHKKKCGNVNPLKCDILCPICGKKFDKNSLFTQHMMFHEDVRPFPCSFCAKSFRNKFQLKAHERLHLDIKPYACDLCSKSFVTISTLKKHRSFHNTPGYKGHVVHKSPHNIVKVTMHNDKKSNLDYTKDRNFIKNSVHENYVINSSIQSKDSDCNEGSVADHITNEKSDGGRKIEAEEIIKSKVHIIDNNPPHIASVCEHDKDNALVNFHSRHSPEKSEDTDIVQEIDNSGIDNNHDSNDFDMIQEDSNQFEDNVDDDKKQIKVEVNEETKQFNEQNTTQPTNIIVSNIPKSNIETFDFKLQSELFKKEVDQSSMSNVLEENQNTTLNTHINADTEIKVEKEFVKIEITSSVENETILDKVKNYWIEDPIPQSQIFRNDSKHLVKCCICEDELKNAKLLLTHKHNSFEMLCIKCNKKFTELKDLQNHLNKHLNKKSVICNICGKSFRKKTSLIVHVKECGKVSKDIGNDTNKIDKIKHLKTKENNLNDLKKIAKCLICHKQFKSELQLKKHRHNTFNMLCLICDSNYTKLKDFRHHLNEHIIGKRNLICNTCENSFRTKPGLIRHIKTCRNKTEPISSLAMQSVKKHLCSVCGKKFGTKHGLIDHMMFHEDVRPFLCSQCPKRFRKKVRLREHENTHLGLKPYMCDICGKFFISVSNMRAHKLKHGNPRFKKRNASEHGSSNNLTRCFVCDVTVYNLSKHCSEHYTKVGVNFECKICSKNVKDKTMYSHYRNHLKAGYHKCDICDKGFNGKKRMLSHRELHAVVESKLERRKQRQDKRQEERN